MFTLSLRVTKFTFTRYTFNSTEDLNKTRLVTTKERGTKCTVEIENLIKEIYNISDFDVYTFSVKVKVVSSGRAPIDIPLKHSNMKLNTFSKCTQ